MTLEALRAWAAGRPIILAHYAHQVAVTANDCYELCRKAQTTELFALVGHEVKPSLWLKYYRGKRTALEHAWDSFFDGLDVPQEVEESFKEAYTTWTEQEGKFIVGAKKNREVEARYWDAVEEWHYGVLGSDGSAAGFDRLFTDDPAFAFAFRVEIPYYLILGTPVRDTYRAARLGDAPSIGRLLRFDPFAIEDKPIRERLLAILGNGREAAKQLKTELGNDTSRLISRSNMKALLGANVAKVSDFIERLLKDIARKNPGMKVGRVRLWEPDIRALFDAVAKDFHGQDLDTDLPESPEAFAQALKRAKKFWPDVGPYKK